MLQIRIAERSDLANIVLIYNQAIRSRTATGDMDEFKVEDRHDWFDRHVPEKYPISLAELEGEVRGFGTISPYRPGRRAMDSAAEVSFFIDYQHHKKGIGSRLLKHMMNECKSLDIDCLLAILLNINPASIALLQRYGFEEWAYLPDIIQFEDTTCSHLYYGIKGLSK